MTSLARILLAGRDCSKRPQLNQPRLEPKSNGIAAKLGRWLALALGCLTATTVDAAQKRILFYGPTHEPEPNGVAARMILANPSEFAQIGAANGSDVWTPGDSNPAKDWSKKTPPTSRYSMPSSLATE